MLYDARVPLETNRHRLELHLRLDACPAQLGLLFPLDKFIIVPEHSAFLDAGAWERPLRFPHRLVCPLEESLAASP